MKFLKSVIRLPRRSPLAKLGFLKCWFLPFTGLAALIWFLIRVIPKPSRAAYPCQRLAFPIASGFIVWLMALAASAVAFHKAKRSLVRARYVLAAVCIIISVASIYVALNYTYQSDSLAAPRVPQPANAPIGVAKGVHPGRVAWIHDPNATNWLGSYEIQGVSDGYWWEPNHTDQNVVNTMVSKSLRALTGKSTDYAAWDSIFRYFNQQHGKGDVGYTPGEKIMIKVNFVGLIYSRATTYTFRDNYPNTSPQAIRALLNQLVNVAGVNDIDITVGDTLGSFTNDYFNYLDPCFPDVNYLDYYGTSGRGKTARSGTRVYWADANSNSVTNKDYVPNSYKNASYLINFANLKGHYNQAGITVCGKNHYGSLCRVPNQSGYYDLHGKQVALVPGMGHYRNLVDLMGHPDIGGKTVLFLIDGLYPNKHAQTWPIDFPFKWQTAPFNNDWASSFLASQDPVAIDSVGFDFIYNEWPNEWPGYDGVDDYLHEAALLPDPCSGYTYDPDGDGNELTSQGVHEHWNNATDKQYSKNLGLGDGIELVKAAPGSADLSGDWWVDFNDFARFANAWGSTTGGANWDPNCDISLPADGVINELDLAVLAENWLIPLTSETVVPGATIQQVYYDASYNFEGPTWDSNSNKLFFTKRPRSTGNYQILRLDSPGSATVWLDNAPSTNGTILGMDGRLLTADENIYQIRSHIIGASGPEDTQVLGTVAKKPNDLYQLSNSNIYFTCPDWSTGPANQGVYLLEPNGVSTRVNNTLYQPNGIIASLDETKLYVAESSSSDNSKKRWWVFPINADGTLGTGSVFFKPTSPPATNDPDGMTIDERGNLYFTGLGGVWIVSPSGTQLKMITVPEATANVCFGGLNGRTLYITCNLRVYSLAMTVRGGENGS